MTTTTTVMANVKRAIIEEEAGKNGRIFTAKFIKKNGDKRTMTCRLGVTKHLKGNGPSTTAHIKKYMTVYDLNAPSDDRRGGYRNLNLETTYSIKGAGQTIEFK